MLDLDDPVTQHRFAAARAGDRLLNLAKLMTLASTEERQRLWEDCREPLAKMRQLNTDHFGASAFIMEAISELECTLNALAALKTEPADGMAYAIVICPACATLLTRYHAPYMPEPELRWSVYCSACLKIISPARRKLDWIDGFGTWAI